MSSPNDLCMCVCVCVCTVVGKLKSQKEKLNELDKRYDELSEPLEYSDSKQKKLFEKCMGLQFRLTEDHAISLVFTNIDPANLERRFVITLDIDDQGQWKGEPEFHVVNLLTLPTPVFCSCSD